MDKRALLQRAPLVVLVAINLGVGTFVGVDLHRRLAPAPLPQGAAEVQPTPTMIPRPTAVVAATAMPPPSPTPQPTPAVPVVTPTRMLGNLSAILVADDRFAYEPGFYAAEVQAFLEAQDSALARAVVPLGKGREDTFAHALLSHCIRYGLNPKVVLALLEVQSGLVQADKAAEEDLQWAFAYRGQAWQGLEQQLQWATFTLADGFRGKEPGEVPVLTDGTLAAIPGEANVGTQSILRLAAYTADAERFTLLRSDGPGSFVAIYRHLFGEDPRMPLDPGWEPAHRPFLQPPFKGSAPISSYFDHEYPIFRPNGTLLSYGGERGYQSYDGHDGWDYALPAGAPVLAAAAGRVVFAGWVDTLCATPAGLVVVDHGQGYRTLYWHLARIDAEEGEEVEQGERVGIVGSTGCSSGPHLHFGVQFLGRDTDPYGWCGSAEIVSDPWSLHPAGTVSRWLWADRPSPCPVPAGAVLVDDLDGQYSKSPALWYEASAGHASHSFWAISVGEARESTHRAVWRPDLPEAGLYYLYAYIPWHDTGRPDTAEAHYRIRYSNGEATVMVDQAHSAGLWAPLGEFSFAKGSHGYVYLDEVTGDPDTTVWFDAVVWIKE